MKNDYTQTVGKTTTETTEKGSMSNGQVDKKIVYDCEAEWVFRKFDAEDIASLIEGFGINVLYKASKNFDNAVKEPKSVEITVNLSYLEQYMCGMLICRARHLLHDVFVRLDEKYLSLPDGWKYEGYCIDITKPSEFKITFVKED